MEQQKYRSTWKKYIAVLRLHLKKSINEEQQFLLNKTDFTSLGETSKPTSTFKILIENGTVVNNINSSSVARDLFETINNDEYIKDFLKEKSVKISLEKSFMLNIKSSPLPGVLVSSNAKPLSLIFDNGEYSNDEILNILSLLSDLYGNISGDSLKVSGMSQFEKNVNLDIA